MRRPSWVEKLVGGLIADPDLRDAVLGDLAEEWSERAVEAGAESASAWYRAQALGSARHLLSLWWRTADGREFWTTIGRAALALAAAVALAVATFDALPIVGGPAGSTPGAGRHGVALAVVMAGAVWALLAGLALGHRTRGAPMAAAALLALGWIPATVVPAAAFPAPPSPPAWFYLAFPVVTALASAIGGATATLLRRPHAAGRAATDSPTREDVMATKRNTPLRRRAARVVAVTAALLAVPLVAMQLTDEVAWDLADFVFAGVLLAGTGLAFEVARTRVEDTAYRAAVGLALAAAFLLVWVNAAVGFMGTAEDPANLMYGGVLAVGLVGAVVARFEPRGMAGAMVATAAAQALVAAIAIVAGLGEPWNGPLELAALNGFWIALWLLAAGLFRRAASEPAPARTGAEG